MTIVALFIGIILVVAALRNSQAALFTALKTDVPSFVVWAAAIVAIGAIGFVPKLSPLSRALLGLILVVIILKNYAAIIAGFNSAWQTSGSEATSATGSQATNAVSTPTGAGGTSIASPFGTLDTNAFSSSTASGASGAGDEAIPPLTIYGGGS